MTPTFKDSFIHYPPFVVDSCAHIQIKCCKSSNTGLTAIHIDMEGPLVSGFLTLATRVNDDNGCPHILEHLIFLGSEKYPYKGTLDLLAPRAYAPGTNAWTDIDHTCYTLTTAGSDGFLQLLPVYADHVLYPTLTDSGFYTEVHHINQNGEDAGVVYCELQARENSIYDIMQRRLQSIIYPKQSGYPFEAGGLVGCIRKLKIESIREYHSQFYSPENLVIIITGKLDQVHLSSTLEQIDKSILDRRVPKVPKLRPWNPAPKIPNLKHNTIETVLFPGEPESLGEVTVTWLGPRWNEFLEIQAIYMMNIYLTDTPISPLKRLFVECKDPYCSEVDFRIAERSRVAATLTLRNVQLDKIDTVIPKLMAALRDIVAELDFDITRMITLIQKEKLRIFDEYETRAAFTLPLSAITASIYGEIGTKDFVNAFQQPKYLDELIKFSKDDWLDLLNRVYLETAFAALVGKPSVTMSQELTDTEKERIHQQRARLGKNGLSNLKKKLQRAIRMNEAQIPARIMETFPIPSVSSISSIDVLTAINPYHKDGVYYNNIQEYINQDGQQDDIPYFIQYDHISSAFVSLSVYLDTSNIPSHLRPYGRIYMDILFASPILADNGIYIEHDEVIQQLDQDLVSYDSSLGYQAMFREYIVINIKVELYKNRLVIGVHKTLDDIPQAKCNGKLVADWTIRAIHTDIKKSTEAACSYLYQDVFLSSILSELKSNPEQIIRNMREFRSRRNGIVGLFMTILLIDNIVCLSENIRVHVIGDILKLDKPKSAFSCWVTRRKLMSLPPVICARDVFSKHGKEPGRCTVVVVLPYTESSYSVHSTKGPTDFDSPDIPPLMVLIEMLHAMEGVYTRLVRGLGLAYRCMLSSKTEAGLISLHIIRSTNILSAFKQMKQVTKRLLDGDVQFDDYALEGAKSSVIFDIANGEGTKEAAAAQSFIIKALKRSKLQKIDLLKAIQEVTMGDIYQMLSRYIVPLFEANCSNHVIVSSQDRCKGIEESFTDLGHSVQTIRMEDIYTRNAF
ncbi:hypothetical protein BCV72DRAFT_235791 [Rhizopus microsporus var. microsporus]|uniref:Uncharacterized protein n=1 Tax=Rhizopus microsporus var. microsporus TaxID=86635 RepID=A0A1X0QPV2_RHIZD|nr:hypothetical protein BCV72DRAFT_235791 [Rhizopus microsporus var. microsporus]